jgi:hypothetical protein
MTKYIFNQKTLQYEEIPKNHYKTLGLICIGTLGLILHSTSFNKPLNPETTIQQYVQPFSEELLRQEIKKLNLPFEEIIVAQSKLETGNYTSSIFKNSHNLFGQKQAMVRVNCQNGVNNNHATYNNWILSLYDYAFWYSTYASKIKNENEYLEYLGQVYAEDTNYIKRINKLLLKN